MSRRRPDTAPRPRVSAPSTTPHDAVGRASMLSPTLDLLCVGGLSLLVMVPLLLVGRTDLLLVSAGVQAWIGTAINMPHFMASYRLVYGSRAMIVKHRWASMYVPAILLAAGEIPERSRPRERSTGACPASHWAELQAPDP